MPWMRIVGILVIEPDRKRKVTLNLHPFVSIRDFHHLMHERDVDFVVQPGDRHVIGGARANRSWRFAPTPRSSSRPGTGGTTTTMPSRPSAEWMTQKPVSTRPLPI